MITANHILIERERRRRAAAEAPPLPFRSFVERVAPRYQWYPHVVQLAAVLQRVADGDLRRLMVFMPPRHGKSELISRLFTAYYLYRYPERFVGLTSYGADLAYTLSRAARGNYLEAGGPISGEAGAVKLWLTGKGGGMWAAGVGGPLTGMGGHLLIIDDPVKNAEEAASETVQESQREWYQSTFSTREEPNGATIVIQTRWHENDLSGWLLDQETSGETVEAWHVVSMEAIKDHASPAIPDTCTLEPDTRAVGEPLCPPRYPLERLHAIQRRIGPYFWNALFQQRPAARDGGMFKREYFAIVPAAPANITRLVRYWDKAATENGGDFTVGLLMGEYGGIYYVLDVVRGQWSTGQRDAVILQTAQLDQQQHGGRVAIWGEQEPGSSGKDVALAFCKMLAGFNVHTEPATGDKQTRAEPFAAQAEAGNVRLVQASWNAAYINELCAFPTGAHDDQVDPSSGAFNKLALKNTTFAAVTGGQRQILTNYRPR